MTTFRTDRRHAWERIRTSWNHLWWIMGWMPHRSQGYPNVWASVIPQQTRRQA